METLALVFPGQGSQREHMGADLLEHDRGYRNLIADANRLARTDVLRELRGDAGAPPSTVATQLSVFALSVALGRRLRDGGLEPRVVAGHSLGEYSALVVGGWLDAGVGLRFVAERAAAMERCCAASDGSMRALMGVGDGELEDLLHDTSAVVANFNSPRQVIVSGPRSDVDVVAERALARGARVLDLPVAGAFHSPLMGAAEASLRELVLSLPLTRGEIPLVTSMSGREVGDLDGYREQLARQITSPVRWADVMRTIDELAPRDRCQVAEVGPGTVLRGLLRHVDRGWPVVPCGSLDDCDRLLRASDYAVAAA